MKCEIDGKPVTEAEWLETTRKRIEASLDSLGKQILESGLLSDEERAELMETREKKRNSLS